MDANPYEAYQMPHLLPSQPSPFTGAEQGRLAFWRWRVRDAPPALRLTGDTAVANQLPERRTAAVRR